MDDLKNNSLYTNRIMKILKVYFYQTFKSSIVKLGIMQAITINHALKRQ